MKNLSIRLCLALAVALLVVIAILSAIGTTLILTRGTTSAQQRSDAVRVMIADSTHWTNHSWQQTTSAKLATLLMTVVIRNSTGQVVYQSGTYDDLGPAFQEVMITDGTHQLGTASIYECTSTVFHTLQTIFIGLIVLLLTLIGVVCFVAWTILKPLSTLSQAAHQVAHNELHFQFPTSRVREVSEVFNSFSRMSEALRVSLERQADLEQERRLFISAIAHDLRTPLFSLRGYLEGLATGVAKTPEKTMRYIEVCQSKAATLEHLIGDLFAYTQLEYLQQVPRQEPLEIGALITHMLESLEPQAQEKGVHFIQDVPATPCIVHADAHLLTRVFENLLDNAMRYTPVGGTIHMNWRPEREHLVFTVTDTGPGISPDDLPHLFTPLYRGDPSRNHHTGGSGLGLTIAQRILHAHGGDLTVKNAAHGGAIFTGSLAYTREPESRSTYTPTLQLAGFL